MPAPPTQRDARKGPDKSGASMPSAVVVIPQLTEEETTSSVPSSAANADPHAPPPIETALQAVATDLESLRHDGAAGGYALHPSAPPVSSIEDLDRALAEIADEAAQTAAAEPDPTRNQRVALELASAVLNADKPVEDTPPVIEPSAGGLPSTDGAEVPEQQPDAEPLPTGDFDAPAAQETSAEPPPAPVAAPADAPPVPEAVAAQRVTAPPIDAFAAPAPAASRPLTAPIAAPRPVPAPEAEEPAAEPAPARRSIMDVLMLPVRLANEPFRILAGNPVALDTLSLVAVITVFNALCLWAFLLLRG